MDRLDEEMTSFLLGGRPWTVEHVNHGDKIVRVRPSPAGQKPSWGGYIPQHLSYTVSQRVREILISDEKSYPYVDTARTRSPSAARQRGTEPTAANSHR